MVEPWGFPVWSKVLDWGRAALALIVSALSGVQLDESSMPRIQLTPDEPPDDHDDTPLDETSADDAETSDAAGEPTSEDILRALREQNAFRF